MVLVSFTIVLLVLTTPLTSCELCSSNIVEVKAKVCPNLPNPSYRFKTLRDLAWFLTPRSYFLTNANSFTYRIIHEGLLGKCAADKHSLEKMRVQASYAFGDLTLSAKDEKSGQKFIHLTCTPKSKDLHGLWSFITSNLKHSQRKPLDWTFVEETLYSLGANNPHLESVVPDLGHFICHTHPLCHHHQSDLNNNSFCSPGTLPNYFNEMESVLTWTDHISNTTQTGSAMMLTSCINNQPSWGLFSSVIQQGWYSIDAFFGVAKNYGFDEKLFERQDYYDRPGFEYWQH